jgi:hypothetical protein
MFSFVVKYSIMSHNVYGCVRLEPSLCFVAGVTLLGRVPSSLVDWPPCVLMAEQHTNYNILSWNIRRFSNSAKQESVKQMIRLHKPLMVCL